MPCQQTLVCVYRLYVNTCFILHISSVVLASTLNSLDSETSETCISRWFEAAQDAPVKTNQCRWVFYGSVRFSDSRPVWNCESLLKVLTQNRLYHDTVFCNRYIMGTFIMVGGRTKFPWDPLQAVHLEKDIEWWNVSPSSALLLFQNSCVFSFRPHRSFQGKVWEGQVRCPGLVCKVRLLVLFIIFDITAADENSTFAHSSADFRENSLNIRETFRWASNRVFLG